jgi:hypothetical protein
MKTKNTSIPDPPKAILFFMTFIILIKQTEGEFIYDLLKVSML